jgi:hypothetical protein
MERNTPTAVSQLLPGDRFYVASDKTKHLWTKVAPKEPKKTFFKTYKHEGHKDGEKYPKYMNSNTKVIFLRHADVKPEPVKEKVCTGD